jgi:hypothetical protein
MKFIYWLRRLPKEKSVLKYVTIHFFDCFVDIEINICHCVVHNNIENYKLCQYHSSMTQFWSLLIWFDLRCVIWFELRFKCSHLPRRSALCCFKSLAHTHIHVHVQYSTIFL